MNQEKYIGMDVQAATISAAVKNAEGKLLMECVLETKAATILEFMQGLRGTLAVTFEEGTLAAWLHDLLKPHVSRGQGIMIYLSPKLEQQSQNEVDFVVAHEFAHAALGHYEADHPSLIVPKGVRHHDDVPAE